MKSKKFVLVGFVLLAITMVLLPLSGCKTDVDSDEDNKPEEHQIDVEAIAPVNPAEGTITYSKTDSGYTFTADFGDNASGDYAWFVDGERQQGQAGKVFTWDTSMVAAGVHEIRVEFGDNDARTIVEVKK